MAFHRWVGAAAFALATAWVWTSVVAQVNPMSILCDDIEAICASEGVSVGGPTVDDCKNGVVLDNITTCNCGFFCIKSLEENDKCYRREQVIPHEACGWGLECMRGEASADSFCGKNLGKPCINEAEQYELTGNLNPGQIRPNCDSEGKYAAKQCSPGTTCYCVDEEGNRIFGETLEADPGDMNCGCSRYWDEIEMSQMSSGMRCLPNGNFDALQCIDDSCFCFDDASKSLTSGPMPSEVLIYMDCYNKSLHTPTYWQPCEEAYINYMASETNNFTTGAREPKCTVDGFYHQVQYKDSYAICSDKYGNQIENFKTPLHKSDGMDCNCARRRQLMEDGNLTPKPVCSSNGNYNPCQTRGVLAYCVDNNGNQVGDTQTITNMHELSCFSNCKEMQA